jgi:protein TonB
MAFSFTGFALILASAAASGSAPAAASGEARFRPAIHRSGTIDARDYPATALRDGASGRALVSYRVDDSGRVVACEVIASSGHPSLDSTSCALLRRRYRFTPARDSLGRPVPFVGTEVISWTLPARAAGSGQPASD